jgi:DNA-binding NtrC family response regulator
VTNTPALLKVCLVEDDPLVIKSLSVPLKEKARLWTYVSLDDLFHHARETPNASYDLIILDLRHAGDPDGTRSISGIPEVIQRWPDAMVIVASGVEEVQVMRQCVSFGADRFVSKEGLSGEIYPLLSAALAWRDRRAALDATLIGDSQALRILKRDIFRVQPNGGDVLLQGETGSGKELVARSLHLNGPFIALNVTTVPKDLFESTLFGHEKGAFSGAQNSSSGMISAAQGGTLFLDEFQSLSFEHQGKLLRFLETREYIPVGSQKARAFRGRVLFASNENLLDLVNRGEFREDLYYRISQLSLKIPPLRVRRTDIPALIERFLDEESVIGRFRFSSEGLDFLMGDYDWPGNIRELKGLVKSLAATSRIPVWGRSEIENALGIFAPAAQWEKKPMDQNAAFEIDWNSGLDANLDRLTFQMLDSFCGDGDPHQAQERLKVKRSRFYELLKRKKNLA